MTDGPPRLAVRLAEQTLAPGDADRLLDALEYEYARFQMPARGRLGADLWFWRQVLLSVPALRRGQSLRRTRNLRDQAALLARELRQLGRAMRRAPISAGSAILTLSLTVGAGTAILVIVDRVLLAPSPLAAPEALVTIGTTTPDSPDAVPRAVDVSLFRSWRQGSGALAQLEAFDPTNVTLTGSGDAERLRGTDATTGFLALLGATPAMGRLPAADDAGRPVVVVSYALWSRAFGADSTVLGRDVILSGQPHTIIGVLPESFDFALSRSDVWRPMAIATGDRGSALRVVARIHEGSSLAALTQTLDALSLTSPEAGRARVTPVVEEIAGDSVRTLGLLGAAAAGALLLAFMNLAVLLTVRSMDRREEFAVRTALGAPASERTRQLLLESGTIVLLGVGGGWLVASLLTPTIGRLALEGAGPVVQDLVVSGRVGLTMAVVAVSLALVCGLVPTVGSRPGKIGAALRRGRTASGREVRMRRIFVAGEVALAYTLLVSMAVLGFSLQVLGGVDPGFEANGLTKLQLSLPQGRYPTSEVSAAFYAALQAEVEGRLGAGTAGLVDEEPMSGDAGRSRTGFVSDAADHEAILRTASAGYFDVLEIPVVAGRTFTDGPVGQDRALPELVISESLVTELFGSQEPVGRRLWLEALDGHAEVVGIVGDVRHRSLDEATLPTMYLSAVDFPSASSILLVRNDGPTASVVEQVRDVVRRLDPDLPVYGVRAMDDVIATSPGVPVRRVLTGTMGGFALLALLLSATGLFGVAAHDALLRRGELSLRLALGAAPSRILWGSLGRGLLSVSVGLAAGGVLSFWAISSLRHLLFEMDGVSVAVTGGAVALLLVAVGCAAVFPVAWRSSRGDPSTVLRGD